MRRIAVIRTKYRRHSRPATHGTPRTSSRSRRVVRGSRPAPPTRNPRGPLHDQVPEALGGIPRRALPREPSHAFGVPAFAPRPQSCVAVVDDGRKRGQCASLRLTFERRPQLCHPDRRGDRELKPKHLSAGLGPYMRSRSSRRYPPGELDTLSVDVNCKMG